ncbi:hypothetical protein C5O79_11050 [Burkholderia sp. SRS-25]|nr:hypothetical protein C5O79_11050 [Burkholderia sp. SRS-25]
MNPTVLDFFRIDLTVQRGKRGPRFFFNAYPFTPQFRDPREFVFRAMCPCARCYVWEQIWQVFGQYRREQLVKESCLIR